MWKYVLLVAGFCGLVLSLLATWKYPERAEGLNVIVYSGDNVYRYNVATDTLSYLRQQPSWDEFSRLIDVSVRPSPNGQWIAITYSAEPDEVYVIDTISGKLQQHLEFQLDDSNNYFGKWSPDSRRIGWITYESRQSQTYVETLDVLTGRRRRFPLPSEFLPAARWRDNRTLEVWSATQFGSYLIDRFTGQTSFEEHVSPGTVHVCCPYAYAIEGDIHVVEDNRHKLVFSTDALEARATPDLQKIAYLKPTGTEEAYIFVYDRESNKNRQITDTSLHIDPSCVAQLVSCSVFGEWSPDSNWIVVREASAIRIVEVNTGQTQTVFDRFGSTTWSNSLLTQSRKYSLTWWILSGIVLLIGLRQFVR